MTGVARLLSWALHPVLMPLLTLLIAFQIDPKLSYFLPDDFQLRFFSLLAIMTIGFPVLSLIMLYRQGHISSLHLPERKERTGPFMLTLLYYCLTYYFIMRISLDPAIHSMLLGAILALALTILINLSWKISIHMVGIGGLLGCVLALSTYHYPSNPLYLIGLLILLSGALGTSRLLLRAHKPAEVYGGFALGLACVFAVVAIGKPIMW